MNKAYLLPTRVHITIVVKYSSGESAYVGDERLLVELQLIFCHLSAKSFDLIRGGNLSKVYSPI